MNYVGCKVNRVTAAFMITGRFYMNYVGCKVTRSPFF